jgi:hypothetical protein
MKLVYETASQVSVWEGEEESNSDLALNLFREISSRSVCQEEGDVKLKSVPIA